MHKWSRLIKLSVISFEREAINSKKGRRNEIYELGEERKAENPSSKVQNKKDHFKLHKLCGKLDLCTPFFNMSQFIKLENEEIIKTHWWKFKYKKYNLSNRSHFFVS